MKKSIRTIAALGIASTMFVSMSMYTYAETADATSTATESTIAGETRQENGQMQMREPRPVDKDGRAVDENGNAVAESDLLAPPEDGQGGPGTVPQMNGQAAPQMNGMPGGPQMGSPAARIPCLRP